MIRNLFLVAIRNLRRHLSYAVLNVLGLTLGIATCIIIFLVVRNELSYDKYHQKADRIYRVTMNAIDFNPSVSMAIAPALKADFPEFEEVTQIWNQTGILINVNDQRYNENGYYVVDQAFPRVFDLNWLAGDARTALSDPNTVVLTESLARKYFGRSEAMGKMIKFNNEYNLKVTGIVKDQPSNTHLPFTSLVSFATMRKELDPEHQHFYRIMGGSTYVVAKPGFQTSQWQSRMPAFIKGHWGDDIAKEAKLLLQPLNEIHYDLRYMSSPGMMGPVSRDAYMALGAIGLLILIIAIINFINLSTAQSIKRAKEVGVRKVLGADRFQLIRQFLGETSILVMMALIVGLVLAIMFLSKATDWLDIKLSPAALTEPSVIGFIAAMTILLILLAGLYPAFVQSAFNPATAFKHKKNAAVSGFSLRKSLVVVQFVISQMLIIGTLVVAWQMDFFRNQDLGFKKEAVVTFFLPDDTKGEALRQQLAANPGVKNISLSNGAPAYSHSFAPFSAPERGILKDDVTEMKYIDENYIDMFGLTMLAGEKIKQKRSGDTLGHVVVNEALIHKLGIQDPQQAIGVTFKGAGRKRTITGVIKDFQSESKHKQRRPLIIDYNTHAFFHAAVQLQGNNSMQTMNSIDKIWTAMFPDQLFEYEFIDDRIASFYQQEQRLYTAFRLFAGIAILIGCLGLYGLITFATVQRTKEVGVRKVLGASLGSIALLFSKEFVWLIAIAFCVAAPVAWYLMNNWLQNFAYHIHIGAGIFLVAITASFVIAAISIAYQTIRAALANPVKALRTE